MWILLVDIWIKLYSEDIGHCRFIQVCSTTVDIICIYQCISTRHTLFRETIRKTTTYNSTDNRYFTGANSSNHLSVICVVFLWSVSIDKAYLIVLVVISKLLGQFLLGMRQLSRMNMLVFKKRLVASSKSIIREKVNVIFVTIVNKAYSVWTYYFNNQHPLKPKW